MLLLFGQQHGNLIFYHYLLHQDGGQVNTQEWEEGGRWWEDMHSIISEEVSRKGETVHLMKLFLELKVRWGFPETLVICYRKCLQYPS